jgi:F-type H+-transporting ATPase subunit delta
MNGVLDEAKARQILDQVVSIKPRGYVAILSQFARLVKLDLDRRSASVESVLPLDDLQQGNVKSALTSRYGPGLMFTFRQNPALIGGMRVQVGSDVYDGSIQSRLQQLEEN